MMAIYNTYELSSDFIWYNALMKLFSGKRKESYDSERLKPAIRSSICTGERVAGFKDRETGHFTEVRLIRTEKDLDDFKREYGITEEIEVFY